MESLGVKEAAYKAHLKFIGLLKDHKLHGDVRKRTPVASMTKKIKI